MDDDDIENNYVDDLVSDLQRAVDLIGALSEVDPARGMDSEAAAFLAEMERERGLVPRKTISLGKHVTDPMLIAGREAIIRCTPCDRVVKVWVEVGNPPGPYFVDAAKTHALLSLPDHIITGPNT